MTSKPRIAVGRLWQETNTFSQARTTLQDFRRFRYHAGAKVLDETGSADDELSGFRDVLQPAGVTIVPLVAANCWCGGPVEKAFVADVLTRITSQLRQAPPLDGVVFSLHGALVGEGTPDVEGEVVKVIRHEIGPNVPLIITLAHHANVTRATIDACDTLTAYRHCPHLDMRETGRRGARLLLRLIRGEYRPTMVFQKLPLATPCEQFVTDSGPMHEWFSMARNMEEEEAVIDVSTFPVQPWIDVPEFGWSVVVTTDANEELARRLCHELTTHAWANRNKFYIEKYDPAGAVSHAAAAEKGPVVIADGADATNGGSPGDSTCLLREMLAQQISSPAFLTMVDSQAVQHAREAGAGAEIDVCLGAKQSSRYHQPVRVRAYIERFSDGKFTVTGHSAQHVNMGQCALLRVGVIYIVVSEHSGPGHDPGVYRQIGLEPRDAQIVVVKCTVGHMNVFADIMTESLACECPGPSPSYLDRLDYQSIPRPIYPLDPEMSWRAL